MRVCHRYQEIRGDRLAFSCECAGRCCPDAPTSPSAAEQGTAGIPTTPSTETTTQGDTARSEEKR